MLLSSRRVYLLSLTTVLAGAVISCCLAWAAENDKQPGQAAGKPDVPTLTTQPAGQPKADPFAVPDGTPEQLLQYLKSLEDLRPASRDRETVVAFVRKLGGAVVGAADKILAGNATKEQKTQAAHAKFAGLMLLGQLPDKATAEAIRKLPAELTKLGLPEVAREIQAAVLEMQFDAAAAGRPGAPAVAQAMDAIRAFVGQTPDKPGAGLILSAYRSFQESDKMDQLLALCEAYGKVFAKSNVPEVDKLAKLLEGTARRLKLVGHPMQVEGTMIDGKPFDWAKYKGKVVLVQFWATWCQPCMAELASVEKAYKLYHDRGFDVVGISIDDDRAALDEFVARNKLRWTILSDTEEAGGKSKHPTPEYYGVIGVPTMILIGPEGKVVSLDVRGPLLAEGLEKLLGPPPAQPEPKTPEAKPAP